MSIRNDACTILRSHGINAYEQSSDIVIFAATSTRWTKVVGYTVSDNQKWTPERLATDIAHKVADLVSQPHTHEIEVPALV